MIQPSLNDGGSMLGRRGAAAEHELGGHRHGTVDLVTAEQPKQHLAAAELSGEWCFAS